MPENTHEPIGPPTTAGKIIPPDPPLSVPEDDNEQAVERKLPQITPTNAKLRELTKKYPPPLEYFEGDEEIPFDPIED